MKTDFGDVQVGCTDTPFVLVVRIHLKKRTFLKVRIILLIDWLHIRGHVDPVCQEYCHPAKIPAMKGVNSMVCEQTNYETGRWKYGAKHMSSERYNFFLQYSIIEMKWNLITRMIAGMINIPRKWHLWTKKTNINRILIFNRLLTAKVDMANLGI